ncbi:MAG TPA: complex I subunit 1 family protein [Myxococcales bacterium LLY-WYZ-16_1]|jgi:NADH-quinone oxidoreductase subunit H|nr:complex I subunit 1 family protein [Myxococcales bacterium LLY-WYZ-16_1]
MTPEFWVTLVAELGMVLVMLALLLGLAGPLTWAERRQSAMIQDRVGPNRAGVKVFGREFRLWGLLHPLADAIKMITKEDAINQRVDRFLYNLAPVITLVPALVTFAVIPIGPDIEVLGQTIKLQVARLDVGILFVFAISSIAVFGVTLAGYASASKLALLGGLRASAQMVSYEVTMGLSIMGLPLIFGTLEPYALVEAQGQLIGGWLPGWGIFLQPISFIIFLTAAMAENKRIPFDLAEGESEIVGYFVEYSGMKFGMFFMAEYVEVITIAGLVTTLFFGGWQVPYLMDAGFAFPWGSTWALNEWVVTALRVGAFMLKLLFFCWFQLMIRWTLPRFRYDQVMDLGWRRLLPLSLANVVVTAGVVLALS